MKRFGKILGLALGFGILAAVLAYIPSRPVAQAAGSAPVVVTNTTAQPVPVAQSGTWNVGITGTPTVGLANGSTVGINNTATTPVLVRDVDNAARHAIQSTLSLIVPDVSDSASGTVFTVPTGERLVIESVSIEADAPSGQKVRARITASLSGNVFWFPPSLWRVPSRCRFPSLRQQLSTMSGLRTSPLAFTRPPARPSRSPSNANRPPPAPPSPQSPSPATLWICRSAGLQATQYPEV